MKTTIIAFLFGLVASAASAQDTAPEEIVVTGSRVDVDYVEMPAVTIGERRHAA